MNVISTDKVIVENGSDFTFVCKKIPFAISCSNLYQGDTNLIDLDLVNKMKIPLRNIKVTRMSVLGHDVRAVGRIKQTVQCVKNGRVKGNIHLEGKVVRDLFSLLDVDCLASSKTYERLMGKKPPDPVDEGYDSQGEIPNLGGDDEEDKSEEEIDPKEEEKEKNSIVKNQEQVPPDPPDDRDPRPSLSIIKSENPNLCIIESKTPTKVDHENVGDNDENWPEDEDVKAARGSASLYDHYIRFGPGPRDLQEFRLNSMQDEDEEQHCELCFREGKPIKIVSNHGDRCPTCPSLTPTQKERMFGLNWKRQAEMIYKMRYNREKGRE